MAAIFATSLKGSPMFSKPTKISEQTPAPQPAVQTTPETPSPAPAVAKPADSRSSAPPSIISAELTLTGDLTSTGEIQIDGKVDGDISSRALTIGEKGTVTGSVSAESVRVCGNVTGEIKGKNVILTKTAEVHGDVVHESLTIEAGAFLDGNVRRAPSAAIGNSKVSVLKPPT